MLFRNFAFWTASIWLLTVFCPLANAVQVGEATKADDVLFLAAKHLPMGLAHC